MNYELKDFTITSEILASAHGVSASCISQWTVKGAFPHLRRKGQKTTLKFHPCCLKFTGGDIKNNRTRKKFIKPIFLLEPLPLAQSVYQKKPKVECNTEVQVLLNEILHQIDQLSKKITRVESKLHNVAEGRSITNDQYNNIGSKRSPTIGDMINKSR